MPTTYQVADPDVRNLLARCKGYADKARAEGQSI